MASEWLKVYALLTAFVLLRRAACGALIYPEHRSDLQSYQDASRCYPDVGEWYLMFRNYYEDPHFGGVRHCVKFRRYGTYSFENHSTSVEFAFGSEGSIRGEFTMTSSDCYAAKDRVIYHRYDNISFPRNFRVLYTHCTFCSILRHPYAANGYGCSYWRRTDTFHEENLCCEYIYYQNCGSSPKYEFFDHTCPL
ncbi:uncharacterized protein LOC142564454 [Dermacentor variabilis]|uniref:uncharacterized protein LOC142564454 n=1 Tax=Dermacentor variabilis TaxID=34621 RepID=UPI003F5BC8A8